MSEQQEYLKRRLAAEEERRRYAQEMIERIDNGGLEFFSATGNQELQNVTAERRTHWVQDIERAETLSAAYRRWYGGGDRNEDQH